jgi:single-stranded-DNA-specific exonuclease
VLLRKALHILGGETEYHIPNRFTEGYGINIDALNAARDRGCTLAISVDCGIRSFDAAEWAAANGLELIITDHHLPDGERGMPNAFAVVNPNRPDCGYPDKHLAGVGVAYKLAHALLERAGKGDLCRSFLKIAAIGTVADVVDLTGENRAIVAVGLSDLRSTRNLGLKALMEISDCTSEMTSYDIGFRIGPRINAAGRMDIATHVVELFESEDFNEARKLASLLDSRNRERRKIQDEVTQAALLESELRPDSRFVVVAGNNWHRGVIGLAASRIAERLHRPCIVLTIDGDVAYGSGRAVSDFHLLNALESCSEIFEQFGGHAAAAGMTIKTANIDELRVRLEAASESTLLPESLVPKLHIDARVSSKTLGLDMTKELKKLEPCGMGNRRPVFSTNGLFIADEPFVMKEKHLKLRLEDAERKRFEAVWWDGVERSQGRTLTVGERIEIAYTAEGNIWQGNTRLQLVVNDIRPDNN